jgi:hypothetical protein
MESNVGIIMNNEEERVLKGVVVAYFKKLSLIYMEGLGKTKSSIMLVSGPRSEPRTFGIWERCVNVLTATFGHISF